jgi:hypothetical protein
VDVRLLWESRASGDKGAFTLRGGDLHLVVGSDGRLDRIAQEPGKRPGLTVRLAGAELRLEAQGNAALIGASGAATQAVLKGGETWTLRTKDGSELALSASGLESAAPPPVDPLVGRTLGSFRVIERLGSGAVGVVYKAIQSGLEREIALKVLNPKAATPLSVASFKREAVAAGRLSHPNLVQVFDIGNDQGLHFYAMELVPGGNLETRLEEHGPLPWQDALRFALDCAEALAFAQEHHLVHRDVKPENLMLTKDGRAKLADLGMAATRGMLEQESAGGTPHFMAPECVGDAAVDHRADFYSLGCTLYRLLTGRTPFAGETVKEILRAHRDQPPPSARAHAPETPAAVDAFVARLMAKSPDARPADAHEVVRELAELLEPRRSRAPMVLLGVAALAAIGVAAWYATRPAPGPAEPERVVEYVNRTETDEERAQREALARELAFTRAMALPAGAERSAALQAFLDEHGETEYSERARAELARLAELAAQPASGDGEDPLARMRAALEALERDVTALLAAGALGEARVKLEASGLPAAIRAQLDQALAAAYAQADRGWSDAHERALAAQDWSAAARVREECATAIRPRTAGAATPADWAARLEGFARAAAAAESGVRERAFAASRAQVAAALHGPVRDALLRLDAVAALAAFDAAIAACDHAALKAALTAERPLFAAAVPAAAAIFARLDGAAEVPILDPLDGKRALAVHAGPEGIRLLVQVRGERVERTDAWSEFDQAAEFQSLLRAVVPPEIPDESVIALHLLFGETWLAAQLRGGPWPSAELARERAAAIAAWQAPLPRDARPEWLARHSTALSRLAALHEALGADDGYLAWQRAHDFAAEFSLLGAWCSDGGSAWQFEP